MAKIILDRTQCIGCGTCWALCGKYFEMAEDGKSRLAGAKRGDKEELDIAQTDCAVEAAEACPVQCIEIK
ncbi:MAG: ferredoxin [Patescibacteria group bacterium]|nr:ferredoxin [Patescibacteria group bacterium]